MERAYGEGPARDFYSAKPLAPDDTSVDHVIPWSFIYSDDIWNLVLTSKSYNSHKSNARPTSEDIRNLKIRNKRLLRILPDGSRYKEDLRAAIDGGYVDRFYHDMR